MANRPIHRLLYRLLPLDGYMRVWSRLCFLWHLRGIGRYAQST